MLWVPKIIAWPALSSPSLNSGKKEADQVQRRVILLIGAGPTVTFKRNRLESIAVVFVFASTTNRASNGCWLGQSTAELLNEPSKDDNVGSCSILVEEDYDDARVKAPTRQVGDPAPFYSPIRLDYLYGTK